MMFYFADTPKNNTDNVCTYLSTEITPKPKHSINIKSTPKLYSNASLESMLNDIRNGVMTVNYASKRFGIPRGTIQYRLSSRYKNKGSAGPFTILTNKEEQDIVIFLKDMEKKGFPITRNSLMQRISGFLREHPRAHPFKNNKPGNNTCRNY